MSEITANPTSRLDQNLTIDRAAIAAFCRRHHIVWLAIFGSALRDDFGPASDVDVLVEFHPAYTPGLIRFAGMEEELAALFARPVDLLTRSGLHRLIRFRVLDEAAVLYDAA